MSIANYLTFMRILMSPVFLLVYLEHELLGISSTLLPYVLIVLVAVSELSDFCDGFLARRYNQVTDLGKILDPMADSISRISVFLTFTLEPVRLHMLLVFIFLYRDSVVSTLRTICALRGFALAARPSGKTKAVVQAVAAIVVLLLMIPHSLGQMSSDMLHFSASIIVSTAAAYSLYSGYDYIYTNRDHIKKLLKLPKRQQV